MTKPTWNGNEGHPLTDLQEYNNILKSLERQQFISNIIKFIWILLIVLFLFYIKYYDIFNNTIRVLSGNSVF